MAAGGAGRRMDLVGGRDIGVLVVAGPGIGVSRPGTGGAGTGDIGIGLLRREGLAVGPRDRRRIADRGSQRLVQLAQAGKDLGPTGDQAASR